MHQARNKCPSRKTELKRTKYWLDKNQDKYLTLPESQKVKPTLTCSNKITGFTLRLAGNRATCSTNKITGSTMMWRRKHLPVSIVQLHDFTVVLHREVEDAVAAAVEGQHCPSLVGKNLDQEWMTFVLVDPSVPEAGCTCHP